MKRFLMVGLLLVSQINYAAQERNAGANCACICARECVGRALLFGGIVTIICGSVEVHYGSTDHDNSYYCIAGGTIASVIGAVVSCVVSSSAETIDVANNALNEEPDIQATPQFQSIIELSLRQNRIFPHQEMDVINDEQEIRIAPHRVYLVNLVNDPATYNSDAADNV